MYRQEEEQQQRPTSVAFFIETLSKLGMRLKCFSCGIGAHCKTCPLACVIAKKSNADSKHGGSHGTSSGLWTWRCACSSTEGLVMGRGKALQSVQRLRYKSPDGSEDEDTIVYLPTCGNRFLFECAGLAEALGTHREDEALALMQVREKCWMHDRFYDPAWCLVGGADLCLKRCRNKRGEVAELSEKALQAIGCLQEAQSLKDAQILAAVAETAMRQQSCLLPSQPLREDCWNGKRKEVCGAWYNEAEHVFGPMRFDGSALQPVVCIVVEPSQEASYREAWPFALILVLPENGRGPGYARWAVQKICTKAFEDIAGNQWRCRRLPFVWIVDDGISMFYRLRHFYVLPLGAKRPNGASRIKEREAKEGARMFWDAFLEVQRHTSMPGMAVAGFLRDDGTAVCKKLDWKSNEPALYKVVLLNCSILSKLGVEYQPDLKMYEDICFINEVLRAGGRTLKCQCFCFRASHARKGGCAEQRKRRDSTSLDDLMWSIASFHFPPRL
jgi:hypothetical protein